MPLTIDIWYRVPIRPLTEGGETSATYIGERMEQDRDDEKDLLAIVQIG
jgi:hypothetical protein